MLKLKKYKDDDEVDQTKDRWTAVCWAGWWTLIIIFPLFLDYLTHINLLDRKSVV